jgi:hypothetical protein
VKDREKEISVLPVASTKRLLAMPRIRSHFEAGFPAAAISRANQKFATISSSFPTDAYAGGDRPADGAA